MSIKLKDTIYDLVNKSDKTNNISNQTPQLASPTETNAIIIQDNPNGCITTNSVGSLASIRKAIRFNWYDSNWQIGNVRSGGTDSDGFGITYGNSNLVFLASTEGCYVNNSKVITQTSLSSALSGYLPLSGGTISRNSEAPLKIEGTTSTGNTYIYIHNKNGLSTAIGKYGTYSFFANYIDNRNTGELQIHDDGRLAIAANNVTNLIWHEGNFNPSDYLPKSGGTITGNLSLNQYLRINAWSGYGTGSANLWYDGTIRTIKCGDVDYISLANGDQVLHSSNYSSYALPLTGGKIKGVLKINGNDEYNTPLIIETPSMGDWGFIQFHTGAKVLGHIGMAGVDMPVFRSASGANNTLIHSGNIGSQSVSYAATARDVMINYTGNNTNYEVVLTNPRDYASYGMDALYHSHNKTITFNPSTGVLSADTFSGNAASATKLQTARSIWGQSFDGTGNISGNLSGVWNLYISSEIILYQSGTQYLTSIITSGNAFKIQPRIEGTGYNVNTLINPSGGNVGIGTTNPQYKLDVNGEISATRGIFGKVRVNKGSGNNVGDQTIETSVSGDMLYLQYYHSGGLNICQGGGNVGIGTTSPSTKLDVHGALKIFDYIDVREPNTKNRFTAYVHSGIGRLYSYNDDTGYNDLYVGQNSTSAIVVKADGSIGIGTGNPAYKLDVSGDIHNTTNIFSNGAFLAASGSEGAYLHSTGISWHNSSNIWVKDLFTYSNSSDILTAHKGLRCYGNLTIDGTTTLGGGLSVQSTSTFTGKTTHNGGALILGVTLIGQESNNIYNVFNDNGAIKTNSTQSGSSIRNALNFQWYDTSWQIGNIRGGASDSAGFGITSSNDNLRFRVTTSKIYCYGGLDVTGNSTFSGSITGNTFYGTAFCTNLTDCWSDGTNTHPWYGYDHGHGNTGVFSTTITDYFGLTLRTGAGYISMTQTGNVGIGTTSPGYKLDISGSLNCTTLQISGEQITFTT